MSVTAAGVVVVACRPIALHPAAAWTRAAPGMGSELEISVDQDGHHALLHVAGLLDAYTGERLRTAITEQLEGGVTHPTVDASRITFVDSSGLRILCDWQTDLEERCEGLVIVRPSRAMAQILGLTEMTDRLGR